jgi:hypothetical protein
MSEEEQRPTLLDQLTWLVRLGDKHGLHEATEWITEQIDKVLDPNALLKHKPNEEGKNGNTDNAELPKAEL